MSLATEGGAGRHTSVLEPSLDGMRQALRDWLDQRRDPLAPFRAAAPDDVVESFRRDGAFVAALHDGGWTRWGWEPRFGGSGGNLLHRAEIYDLLGAHGYPVPERYVPLETLGPALIKYAPELAERLVPPFLQGRTAWCQGFSEPEAGSDLAALRTRAVPDGADFRITGQKIWTSYAQAADQCFVLARTGSAESRHRGISAFFVDMDSPGIDVRPLKAMNGREEYSEVFWDGVKVPRDRLIGKVDGGWEVAMYLMQWERGAYAWHRQAWLYSCFNGLLRSADSDSLDPHAVGEVHRLLYALRLRTAGTLRALAAEVELGAVISADKVLCVEAELGLLDLARRSFGGRLEFCDDSEFAQWRNEWFYTRASAITGGAVDIQRNIIAERVLGLPRG